MKTLLVLSILVVSLVIAKPSEAGEIVDIEYDAFGVYLTYSPATGFSVECTAYTSKGVAIGGGMAGVAGKVARAYILLPKKYRYPGATKLRYRCQ